MARAPDLPVRFGLLPSGPTSSIHDVPGMGLGHTELLLDEPDHPGGRGTVRTGVTVLHVEGDSFGSPVPAGGAVLNGMGECTGLTAVREWGRLESPVFLTSTMQVGRVYDAACTLMAQADPRVGVDDVLIPVVAECDDSGLSDPRWARLSDDDVAQAWRRARENVGSDAPPDEGCVGAGVGMECLGWKGGVGTASRVLPDGHVVGAVVLTNFGEAARLTVAGAPVPVAPVPGAPVPVAPVPGAPVPVAGSDSETSSTRGDRGSCIAVIATDGPLDAHACGRLAARAGMGLARVGSVATHGSGEIFLALATGLRGDRRSPAPGVPVSGRDLDPYFAAAVEATEEAVVTSLLAATSTTGRGGRTVAALPFDDVVRAVVARRGRRSGGPG